MIRSIGDALGLMLGLQDSLSSIIMMSMRGVIVYISSILLIRINRKFFGIRTASNFTLFVMLGSMFATAIIVDGLFLPIISTIFFLSLVNRVVAAIFFYYPRCEELIVGKPVVIFSNGDIHWSNMKKNFISKNDLLNALQTQMNANNFLKIDSAYLATDGTINFILKS